MEVKQKFPEIPFGSAMTDIFSLRFLRNMIAMKSKIIFCQILFKTAMVILQTSTIKIMKIG